jgi:phage pi2 protein 07
MPATKKEEKKSSKKSNEKEKDVQVEFTIPEVSTEGWTTQKRLSRARSLLHQMRLKKTGKVDYKNKDGTRTKFEFYELRDFIPQTLQIFDKVGLCARLNYKLDEHGNKNYVSLVIENSDKPDEHPITFYSEGADATIMKAQKIQNIGGAQSFQRRYLWYQVMEIVENDVIENHGEEGNGDNGNGEKKIAFDEFGNAMKSDDLVYLRNVLNGDYGTLTEKQSDTIRNMISRINPGDDVPEEREIKPSEFDKAKSCKTAKEMFAKIKFFKDNNIIMDDGKKEELREVYQLLLESEKIFAKEKAELEEQAKKDKEAEELSKKETDLKNNAPEIKDASEGENAENDANDSNIEESLQELETLL